MAGDKPIIIYPGCRPELNSLDQKTKEITQIDALQGMSYHVHGYCYARVGSLRLTTPTINEGPCRMEGTNRRDYSEGEKKHATDRTEISPQVDFS
jgi:hypothetical protein